MSTLTAIDWNEWRECYDTRSFAEQQHFYDAVYEQFPEQARFSTKSLRVLLDYVGEPVSIVELGGWDGEFAAEILRMDFTVIRWTNHEISGKAVAASVCVDPRYYGVTLDDWYWAHEHEADVFVASHVIEHLKLKQVVRSVLATDCRYLYLQAPLQDEPTSWRNYRGSHILEVGWLGLSDALRALGFSEIEELRVPNVRCYTK